MSRASKPSPAPERTPGRFAYEGLDRAIHEKARLGIMTSLVAHPDGLSFGDLKELCQLTDGNLNRHLDVLHEAGLIAIQKDAGQKQTGSGRPQTTCRLTTQGRKAFVQYLAELERVVEDAARASVVTDKTRSTKPGWSAT